jgi:hypothetical protein
MTKGMTLEMLLTQFAYENTAPAAALAAHAAGRGSPSDYDDYDGSDDGVDPSSGAAGGSGGSDDEGSSPQGTGHRGLQHSQHTAGATAAGYAYSAYGGCYGAGAASGGATVVAPPAYAYTAYAHGLPALRVQTSAAGCASAGTMFSDEDCCDTYAFAAAALSPPGVHGTGVSPYPRGPTDLDGAGAKDIIHALLDEFAAAGAAAAAAATAATAEGELDDICGAMDAGPAAAAAPAGTLPDGAPKRDLLSRLSGADDAVGSPLKRLRLGSGSGAAASPFGRAPADAADVDELHICYADQRGGGSQGGAPPAAVAAAAAAPAVVRAAPLASSAAALAPAAATVAVPAASESAAATAAPAPAAAAPPAVAPPAPAAPPAVNASALPADWDAGMPPLHTPCAAGPLGLLDALPSTIRGCLADAAGLYLANDASGLAA